MKHFAVVALIAVAFSACGGDDNSPGTPSTPTPTTTRVMSLSGNLAFGNVEVGSSANGNFTISNTGNAALTVSGMTVSGGLSNTLTANWTSGSIAPGASQNVTVTFRPTSAQPYSGTVTVNGDQTSGANTIGVSGTGTQAPPPPPVLPANLVRTGGLSIPSQCEALRAQSWLLGVTTATCTSFSGTMQNTGTGCASNIRGTTIAYTSADVQVGVASWTYGATVRPNEVFVYYGGALTVPSGNSTTPAWRYSTTATWDNVSCQ